MKPRAQQRSDYIIRLRLWLRHLNSLNPSSFICKMEMIVAALPPSYASDVELVHINKNWKCKGALLIIRRKGWVRFLDHLKQDNDKYSIHFLCTPLGAFFLRNQFIPTLWFTYVSAFSAVELCTKYTSWWSLDAVLRGHCQSNHLYCGKRLQGCGK